MSYTASYKLPEDFFQNTIEEKVEMIRKYLKDMGDPLFSTHIGPNMATFKFYFHQEEDSLKPHLFKFRGPTGSVILFMGPVELHVEGE